MNALRLLVICSTLAVADPPASTGSASLTHFNREVVTLRAPLLGMSPAERVAAAQARLRVALRDTEGADVSVVPTSLGRAVSLNGHLLFFVQAGDLDPEAGLTLDQAATLAGERLRDAVTQSLEQRSTERLSRALLEFALASLALAGTVLLLVRVRARALALLDRQGRTRPEVLRLGGLRVVRWSTLVLVASWVVRLVTLGLLVAAGVQWLAFSLAQFPYTQPWGARLEEAIVTVLSDGALHLARAFPNVAVVAAIAWLSWAGMKVSKLLFAQVEAGHWKTSWLTPHTATITRKLVSFTLVLFAIVMAYPSLPGSDTEAFKGLSVLLGVMVSLGGSSMVGQAASGLILIYTHAFSKGDQVRFGDAAGRVTAIGMFTTRLVTHLGEEIIIPNAAILQSTTRNYTREGKTVIEVVVTIGYDVSWRRVEGLLREGATKTRDLLAEPAPSVVVASLDEAFVTYRLVATAPDASSRESVLADLQRNVLDAFGAANVPIVKRGAVTLAG